MKLFKRKDKKEKEVKEKKDKKIVEEKVEAITEKKEKTKFGEKLLTCPRCNIKMKKVKKKDVIIDICKKCKGMWLDAGEVVKLSVMAQSKFKEDE